MIHNNALIFPLKRNPSNAEYLYEGGVLSENNIVIENSILTRGSRRYQSLTIKPKETFCEDKMNGCFLFGGIILNHFGHFITETISRLHHYNPSSHDGIIFLNSESINCYNDLPSWAKKILTYLNINKNSVIVIKEITRINSLVVPPPGFVLNKSMSGDYNRFLQDIALSKLDCSKASNKKVYISRNRFPKGLVAGESIIESLLEVNGFTVIYPEKMPFEEQLTILENADIIVGISGSSLHNIIFNTSREKVLIEIQRRGGSNGTQKIINKNKKIQAYSISAISRKNSNTSSSSVLVDIPVIASFLKDTISDFIVTEDYYIEQEAVNAEYELYCLYETLRDKINKTPDIKLEYLATKENINILYRVIKLRPEMDSVHFQLARVLSSINSYESALLFFKISIRLSNKNPMYYHYISKLYYKLDILSKADRFAYIACNIEPNNHSYLSHRIQVLEQLRLTHLIPDIINTFVTNNHKTKFLLNKLKKYSVCTN